MIEHLGSLGIDQYDLYGRVAYPKSHRPEDVPVLYRLAADQRLGRPEFGWHLLTLWHDTRTMLLAG